jgi:ribosomal protein L37E
VRCRRVGKKESRIRFAFMECAACGFWLRREKNYRAVLTIWDQDVERDEGSMPTITATESTFEGLAEGIHEGMLVGYEEAPDMGFGPGIKLIWNIDDRDEWQFCSQKLSPKSNFWGILKGLGVTPEVGKTYDLDELIGGLVGTSAHLVVREVDTPKGPRNKIVEVMPLKRGK